ncbi:hypothetical protein WJX74_004377 [Apatococcus lobatus]|uniref:Uncharacterized protein n=2 Tax=Apatococcus TaxID=904362 RepID=A0AAW1SLK1_9CHLO
MILAFLSRLGADAVIWSVAVSVFGVCTLGLWQLRSGQWVWRICASLAARIQSCFHSALQALQAMNLLPGWGLPRYPQVTCGAFTGRLDSPKTVKMLPVVCLGDSGSGKTFLLRWLSQGQAPVHTSPTCAADLYIKPVKDALSLLQLWDVGSRLQAGLLKAAFFRPAAGVVLMYDARSPCILESLNHWHQFLLQKCGASKDTDTHLPAIVVLGNLKADATPSHLLRVKTEVAAWCRAHGNLPHKLIPLPGTLVGMEWAINLLLSQASQQYSARAHELCSPVSSPRLAAQKVAPISKPPRSVRWSSNAHNSSSSKW